MAFRIAVSAILITMLFCMPAQAQTAPDANVAPATDQTASAPDTVAPPVAAVAAEPSDSALDRPIEQIAGTAIGCAVLDKDFPGLRDHPMYPFFKAMSLNQIAAMSHGKITPDMLAQADTDLAGMSVTPIVAKGP